MCMPTLGSRFMMDFAGTEGSRPDAASARRLLLTATSMWLKILGCTFLLAAKEALGDFVKSEDVIDGSLAAFSSGRSGGTSVSTYLLHTDNSVSIRRENDKKANKKIELVPTVEHSIKNLVPFDFNGDGKVDLAIYTEGGEGVGNEMTLYLAGGGGKYVKQPTPLQNLAQQPFAVDMNNDGLLDFIGEVTEDKRTKEGRRMLWLARPQGESILYAPAPWPVLALPEGAEGFQNPHSMASVDVDGDCISDLVVTNSKGDLEIHVGGGNSYMWSPADTRLYVQRPQGSGPVTFVDLNSDGALDLVYLTCAPISTGALCGDTREVHVSYNTMATVCGWRGDATPGLTDRPSCVDATNICTSRRASWKGFGAPQALAVGGRGGLVASSAIKTGDVDLDGRPDMAVVWRLSPSAPVRVRILMNRGGGKLVESAGGDVEDVSGVDCFGLVDLQSNGKLDLAITTSASGSDSVKTQYFLNGFEETNFFFFKMTVLNGKGGFIPGVHVAYVMRDQYGVVRMSSASQSSQNAYAPLQAPSSHFGLGQTVNYIQSAYVGTWSGATRQWSELIPNSELVVTLVDLADPGSWTIALIITFPNVTLWVSVVLGLACALFGLIYTGLHVRETRQDRKNQRLF